ncbi:60S ribosomal protein L18-2 [Acorus gramineus]|uniref:60S ribosomal protein L18-2 n=1 Tax=Acorus gramineus TaxID=55184 RepID=A0AAV9AK93_ACOGR|nr:60S ribosomal protein L18-2 [Acorus gramineus]
MMIWHFFPFGLVAKKESEEFGVVILKRLFMSKTNMPPLSLSRLIKFTNGKEDKIAVVVGCITVDTWVYEVPALKVTALRFTKGARARITNAGGECLTFDQLAFMVPLGKNTVSRASQSIGGTAIASKSKSSFSFQSQFWLVSGGHFNLCVY